MLTSSEALALGKPLGGRRTDLPQGSGTQPPLRGSVSHPLQPPDCMTLSAWILLVVESSLLPKIVHPEE